MGGGTSVERRRARRAKERRWETVGRGRKEKRRGSVANRTPPRRLPKTGTHMTNLRCPPGPCPSLASPPPRTSNKPIATALLVLPPRPHRSLLHLFVHAPSYFPPGCIPASSHSLRRSAALPRYRQVPSFPASLHSDRTTLPPSILFQTPLLPPSLHRQQHIPFHRDIPLAFSSSLRPRCLSIAPILESTNYVRYIIAA